jgi:transposase
MSTSFLYHTFGLVGYIYVKTEYRQGQVLIYICKHPGRLRCPECDSHLLTLRGSTTRKFKSIPIGGKKVVLVVQIQRVACKKCHCIRQIQLGFADPKKTYTKALARYVLELSKHMTIKDVAEHLQISWDMVKNIQKEYLLKHFTRPRLKDLKKIAIDEISIGKRHNYLTIVLDLSSGAVVYIGDGKGADSLKAFWKKLKAAHAAVEAVAIDMSPAYIQAVSGNLKNAAIVFDHFHVVKLLNDKLSILRRLLYWETTDVLQREALKGLRWILLKNPENLDEKRNEKERLETALKINAPLATAYYLKEELRQLWSQESKEEARDFLNDWTKRAAASGVRILQKFAGTMMAHQTGILAYYDHPISTGPLEGTNNKIKTMQRQAYGFRDKEFSRLKIFAIHRTKYALVG